MKIAELEVLLKQAKKVQGNLEVVLKDADTGWIFPLEQRHFFSINDRIEIKVRYTDDHN